MIRSDLLATFVLIADAGSMNAAATRLGISRSVVSERLAALETDLGAKLVTRSTRGLSLTPAGELFLDHARTVIGAMDAARDAVADADGTLTGRLRLATPAALAAEYLVPLFASFLQAHPRISVEISASDRTIDVARDGFDLAIRSSRAASPDMIVRQLTTGRRIVVCSPSYAARHGVPGSPAELLDHTALVYRNRRIVQEWVFRSPQGARPVRIASRFESDEGNVLRAAAVEGLGLGLMPTFMVARDVLAGRLQIVDLGAETHTDSIMAVYPRSNRGIPRIRALVDHLRTGLGDPPPWDRDLAAAGLLPLDDCSAGPNSPFES